MSPSNTAEPSPGVEGPLRKCGTGALACADAVVTSTADGGFATPFRALLWKEWRESWGLLVLAVTAPAGWFAFAQVVGAAPFPMDPLPRLLYILAVPCAVALSLAARLFAAERAQGTASFQAERPLMRGMVWNAKLLLPVLAVLMGATIQLVIFWLLTDVWRDPGHWRLETLCSFFRPPLIMFASAMTCSVLLDRPVTAWAAGGVLAAVLLSATSRGTWTMLRWVILTGQTLQLNWFFTGGPARGHALHVVIQCVLLVVEPAALLWLSRIAYVRWRRE